MTNNAATISYTQYSHDNRAISWLFFGLLLAGLCLTSLYGYPVFHTLAEMFSVFIACGLFALVWNTRRYLNENYLLLLGIISLCSGVVDMFHLMAYKGVALFAGYDNNLPTALWIAARYLQSAALFIVTLRLSRRAALEDTPSIIPAFLNCGAITTLLVWSVFAGLFPVCWIEGTGLTPFKKVSEVIISALFAGCGVLLWRRRASFNSDVVHLLLGSFAAAACAEIAFIFFVNLFGISNLLGHVFKIISYYLLYRAVIKKGLQQPMDLLFRKLRTNNADLEREIAGHKQAEKALQHTYDLLNAIIQAAPTAIIGLDLDGKVQAVWNPAAEKMLGWSAEEVMGRFLPSIPMDREEEFRQFRQQVRHGKTFNGKEVRRQRRDGIFIDYSIYSAPLHDPEARITGYVAVLADITERKRMEEALAAREQEFRAMIENAPDPILRYDRECNRIYVNPAAERLCGKQASSLLGSAPGDGSFVSSPEAGKMVACIRQVLETGMTTEGEVEVTAQNGVKHYFLNRYAPEWGKDGNVASVLLISRDISERKQIEKELQSKNSELERFTYTVSHDLKSPLITIKSFSGSIRNDLVSGRHDRLEKDLGRIDAAAGRMAGLLDDLLKLSRVGHVINTPEEVDMASLAHDVLKSLDGILNENNARVSVQPGLPTMMCDRQRMMEVMQNLLENAVKYRGDQPEPRILVGLREEGDRQVFFVRDNGPGIDPKYHENIFGLFNRVNTKVAGTGIGLALVKRIIETHGGRIWVESDGQGNGSTFSFTVG